MVTVETDSPLEVTVKEKTTFRTVRTALVRVLRTGPELLLVLDNSRMHSSAWRLPGGKIEDGETVREAQEREFLEETGAMFPKRCITRLFSDNALSPAVTKGIHLQAGITPHACEEISLSFVTHEVRAVRWFALDALPIQSHRNDSLGCPSDDFLLRLLAHVFLKRLRYLDSTGFGRDFRMFVGKFTE